MWEAHIICQLRTHLAFVELTEIAIYYCEHLLKLRMPPISSISSQQQEVSFTHFAHEIQLKHQIHLTEALDEKKRLLGGCRSRFWTMGSFAAVGKCLDAKLLSIQEMGPVFNQEQRFIDTIVEEEESNYVSPFLVEVIATNAGMPKNKLVLQLLQ